MPPESPIGGPFSDSGLEVHFDCGLLARLALPFCRVELHNLFRSMAGAVFAPQDADFVQVELLVADEGTMEDLNLERMGCPGPTNILSFPAVAPLVAKVDSLPLAPGLARAEAPLFLGSLVLAPHTLKREAFLYGQEARSYCIRLLAHGFAHLLGLEHGPEMDAVAQLLEQGFTLGISSGNKER